MTLALFASESMAPKFRLAGHPWLLILLAVLFVETACRPPVYPELNQSSVYPYIVDIIMRNPTNEFHIKALRGIVEYFM